MPIKVLHFTNECMIRHEILRHAQELFSLYGTKFEQHSMSVLVCTSEKLQNCLFFDGPEYGINTWREIWRVCRKKKAISKNGWFCRKKSYLRGIRLQIILKQNPPLGNPFGFEISGMGMGFCSKKNFPFGHVNTTYIKIVAVKCSPPEGWKILKQKTHRERKNSKQTPSRAVFFIFWKENPTPSEKWKKQL